MKINICCDHCHSSTRTKLFCHCCAEKRSLCQLDASQMLLHDGSKPYYCFIGSQDCSADSTKSGHLDFSNTHQINITVSAGVIIMKFNSACLTVHRSLFFWVGQVSAPSTWASPKWQSLTHYTTAATLLVMSHAYVSLCGGHRDMIYQDLVGSTNLYFSLPWTGEQWDLYLCITMISYRGVTL